MDVISTNLSQAALAELLGIIKRHDLKVLGTPERWAIFSMDEVYRYALVSVLEPTASSGLPPGAASPANAFIGLNPSKATHEVHDPTHEKCREFARRWGFRYNWMLNVFAVRGTDPKTIKQVADPVGPANNEILAFAAKYIDQLVAAWGKHAAHLARGARVRRELVAAGAQLRAFRFNKDGSPEHPLYMPYEQTTEVWT